MRDFIEYLEYSENESRKFIGREKTWNSSMAGLSLADFC